MSTPNEPPTPLPHPQRFKEYEDHHFHDEDELGPITADDEAASRPAHTKTHKPKPKIVPTRRRFAPED